ncbi:MAG: hypothetical protein MZW92_70530 [Comamonadaceae bacterium]|nr:hypothetical protein [Comamonadaceae bacterium]
MAPGDDRRADAVRRRSRFASDFDRRRRRRPRSATGAARCCSRFDGRSWSASMARSVSAHARAVRAASGVAYR